MAFAARRSIATRLSHHLTRRLHPCVPHALTSHSPEEQASSPPPLPLPLPPLQTPFQHRPRAAQTLGFLPFSLHLAGTTRRSFSSSAPATASAPDIDPAPAAEVDAAGVLADAAEAAASVPAPFPGEVAAAAADSFFPVAALQHFIDAIHTFTALNWWACIALTTVIIRTATVPLLVNQLKATTKLNAIKPEMEAIKDQTDTMDLKSAQEGKAKMKALFKKHGVSPFTPLKGVLIQGPIFMSFFFAITNMVEKVPSLKGGGTLWFTDLTTPDSLYILPVLTGLTFLATVELNLQEGMQGNPMGSKMKYVSRGMAFLSVPLTMNFSKGIFCYWITSNIFSLVYGLVIHRPGVRKLLNLPPLAAQPSPATKPIFNLFGGSPAAESPVAIAGAQRAALVQPDAAALGYKVKNLEKKVKSRGKRKHRVEISQSNFDTQN
ncbi:Mitochondrial inner membrane protein OXA1 [Dichanthelium oligosanthes]|uniref:Mitochondrial inner membrane protein OXA1 n=1 Tax=Dichanthelium oligosanthes TaxID=888268 RepID=A0A1E5W4Q5_9POAL|nr:Mitochondrial inner membrane protein OXA1 [Dichanthelium oligosanthes]